MAFAVILHRLDDRSVYCPGEKEDISSLSREAKCLHSRSVHVQKGVILYTKLTHLLHLLEQSAVLAMTRRSNVRLYNLRGTPDRYSTWTTVFLLASTLIMCVPLECRAAEATILARFSEGLVAQRTLAHLVSCSNVAGGQ